MDFLKNNTIKLFAIIIGVAVVIIIIISLLTKSGGAVSGDEKSLLSAAKRYYETRGNLLPKNDYESSTVTISTLVSSGYIKSTGSCFSYVTVVKSGSEYVYTPYVKCNDKDDTKVLLNMIKSNAGTVNDGAYKINDEYIYKGENPNNYVKFSEELWRVVKVDKNDIIKIIYADYSYSLNVWDDRYNIDTDDNSGINNYSVSRVQSALNSYLSNDLYFTNEDRAKLTYSDLCIGKRKVDDNTTDGSTECTTKLEKQLIGLIQANEYLEASNDVNCSPASQVVCQNYNFLANKSAWTITAVDGSTSNVYKIKPDQGLKVQQASYSENLLPVLYLRSDVAISGGKGTKEDPYVIK